MPDHRHAWNSINAQYGISKVAFARKLSFIDDEYERRVIFRDIAEAHLLAMDGFSKAAVVLAGGVIEELLTQYLSYKGISHSARTFYDIIETCRRHRLLKGSIQNLSQSLREFRNIIHISNEPSPRHAISQATAMGAVASIFTIANDFTR